MQRQGTAGPSAAPSPGRALTWPTGAPASPLSSWGGNRPPPPSCGFGVLGPACTAQGECSERLTGRRFGKRDFQKRVRSCPWLSSLPPPGCPFRRTPGPPPGRSPFRVLEHEMGVSRPGSLPCWGSIPSFAENFFQEAPVAVRSPNWATGRWPSSAQSPRASERSLVEGVRVGV